MYGTLNVNVESVGPGLREYNLLSRRNRSFNSGLGRPIGCFAFVGFVLTLSGVVIFVWAHNKPGEQYTPFKTFGSTFSSIGIFVLLISMVLLCEAGLTGRCKRDPDSTRSSREDLRSHLISPRLGASPSSSPGRLLEVDQRSLLLSQVSEDSRRSCQTFPYPIPAVRVEYEAGNQILSKSL